MNSSVGFALAIGLIASCGSAWASSPASCTERFQQAGVDSSRLSPGDRGRLDGVEFIVAKDDVSAAKICARVDAEKAQADAARTQLAELGAQLARARGDIAQLRSGGPIKQNYLIVDGCLLAWAVIASIWASYFAGRLDPRRR